MEILRTILTVIYVIDCIALTVVVLMQEGNSRVSVLSQVSQTLTGEETKAVLQKEL